MRWAGTGSLSFSRRGFCARNGWRLWRRRTDSDSATTLWPSVPLDVLSVPKPLILYIFRAQGRGQAHVEVCGGTSVSRYPDKRAGFYPYGLPWPLCGPGQFQNPPDNVRAGTELTVDDVRHLRPRYAQLLA